MKSPSHPLSRRAFLRLMTLAAASAVLPACSTGGSQTRADGVNG